MRTREVTWRLPYDWQGIPWETEYMQISREHLRDRRLRTYRSFRNESTPLEPMPSTTSPTRRFFRFNRNLPQARCAFNHFQLKKNVQMSSPSTLHITTGDHTIEEFNVLTKQSRRVKHAPELTIYSYHSCGGYLVCGGMEGELHLDSLSGKELLRTVLVTEGDSRMTNSCMLLWPESYLQVLASSNDKNIRFVDPKQPECAEKITMEACVNYSALSADARLVAAALDSTTVPLIDRNSCEVAIRLEGHVDYSFGVVWNPVNQFELASCNQDHTVRVWDIRMARELHRVNGKIGAMLNLAYSPSGKYLVCSESIDFLHVVDTRSYQHGQLIDIFGEISGFACTETSLYVGIADRTYASLLEFVATDSADLEDIRL